MEALNTTVIVINIKPGAGKTTLIRTLYLQQSKQKEGKKNPHQLLESLAVVSNRL